jgi:CRISPR-associated protein Csh2
MTKSREYMMFWDSTMANPNGDMLNDNQPRYDEFTRRAEVSDVRIKRFIRDEMANSGENVFVRTVSDEKGNVYTCTGLVGLLVSEQKKINKAFGDADVMPYILKNYVDVRLFGAVITKPKNDITGPLQVAWSRSVNEVEIKFAQGNSAYASGEGKQQATLWGKYFVPYALFKTYAVFNNQVAKAQGIEVTEEDLEKFVNAYIYGLINYRSTSKNQMPRLLVEVVYKEHRVDGELNYVDVSYDCEGDQLRSIDECTFDIARLVDYYESKKDVIDSVRLYKHKSVKLDGIPAEFKVITI